MSRLPRPRERKDQAQRTRVMEDFKAGARRIVALRGDLPSGSGAGAIGELAHANELVALIRERRNGK